jgi:pyruvate dehydrogenase E1 component alpha subunit
LLAQGVSEAQLVEIETDVAAMVDLATEEAKAGAVPGEEYLLKDVWADGGYQWRN